MILTDLTAVQKTIERFLDAHREYVLKATKKGKLVIEVSQRFVDGKYQERNQDTVLEKRLKRIPISTRSILGRNHS